MDVKPRAREIPRLSRGVLVRFFEGVAPETFRSSGFWLVEWEQRGRCICRPRDLYSSGGNRGFLCQRGSAEPESCTTITGLTDVQPHCRTFDVDGNKNWSWIVTYKPSIAKSRRKVVLPDEEDAEKRGQLGRGGGGGAFMFSKTAKTVSVNKLFYLFDKKND